MTPSLRQSGEHAQLGATASQEKAVAPSLGSRHTFTLVLLLIILAGVFIASVAFGARPVSIAQIFQGLTDSSSSDIGVIAVRERLPRTVTALVAGAALAVSGALMQSLTRNPIADPGILGINAGSALAVVIGIAFFSASTLWEFIALSLIGASLTALFVQAVGSVGPGGATPIKLALAGMATSAVLLNLVSAIMLPRTQGMDAFRQWQVGSLGRGTWGAVVTILPLILIAFVIAAVIARPLDSLAMGDDMAIGLGVHVGRTRLLAGLAGVMLCATVTALTGPIAFIGLMVPHVVRLLIGPSHGWLLVYSILVGAILLTVSDVIGRILLNPGEVPVTVITAFLGAPILIVVARRTTVRGL